ncbi:MAG: hypothetical protein RIE31_09280 [Alphaproteobacteria bacterium]
MIEPIRLGPSDALPIDLPGCHLVLERCIPHVLPDQGHAGFGTLAFAPDGRIWCDGDGRTRLYTTTHSASGQWVSQVRSFSTDDLQAGQPHTVLSPLGEELWAVIHLVVRVAADQWLAFHSWGRGLAASLAPTPEGPFTRIPRFSMAPQEAWEWEGGAPDVASLEANGCFEPISHDGQRFTFWLGYDSYHVDETTGRLAWARLVFDGDAGTLTLQERHRDSPLPFQPDRWIAARCGGNLERGTDLGGFRPYFYYTRPTRNVCLMALALARPDDPLFLDPVWRSEVDKPLGPEEVIEKFECWRGDDRLHMLYEARHTGGLWRTGYRAYAIT